MPNIMSTSLYDDDGVYLRVTKIKHDNRGDVVVISVEDTENADSDVIIQVALTEDDVKSVIDVLSA